MIRRAILGAMAGLVLAAPVAAAADCVADAMIVFDGSGSMGALSYTDRTRTRITEARLALARTIPEAAERRRLGLIVYGPGGAGGTGITKGCNGVDLRFAPRPGAGARLLGEVASVQPAGPTPLTAAVELAAEVLDYRARPGTVVLITDGAETCQGATCALAGHLATAGADLTVHVIGFRPRASPFDWQSGQDVAADALTGCLAERTGGLSVTAETLDDLTAALTETLGCPVFGALGDGGAGAG